MLAGSALMVAATLASWLALVTVGALRATGFHVSPLVQVVLAAVAGPIALAALVRTLASVWRGPPVIAFDRRDAVSCRAGEAEAVRASAQLRGTMGGAGHVQPARLAFPVASMASAIVAGVEGVIAPGLGEAPWPLVLAVGTTLAAWLFPSAPFSYREVTGGGVLVTPPAAAALIAARHRSVDTAGEVESDWGA